MCSVLVNFPLNRKTLFELRKKEWISEWLSQLCTQLKQLRKESLKKNSSLTLDMQITFDSLQTAIIGFPPLFHQNDSVEFYYHAHFYWELSFFIEYARKHHFLDGTERCSIHFSLVTGNQSVNKLRLPFFCYPLFFYYVSMNRRITQKTTSNMKLICILRATFFFYANANNALRLV